MSLCNLCPDPGYCCRGLVLTSDKKGDVTAKDGTLVFPAEEGIWAVHEYIERNKMPFQPVDIERSYRIDGKKYNSWTLNCPKLQRDGRCGAYEDRPENCRNFEASTTKTPTCVFYKVKSIGGI